MAFLEQPLTAVQLERSSSAVARVRIFVQRLEQRRPPEHVSGVLHRSLLAGLVPLAASASGLASDSFWPCPY